jgi:putative oligomerization/nucleic acid binding protein/phospholipase D-like protein
MSNHSVILADAQHYPLLNLFWTMLELFLWIAWFVILFRIIADIFRSSDLNGWGKAAWMVFIIILPFLGVFIYLIARGSKMHERDIQAQVARENAFRSYVQQTAAQTSATSAAEELTKLAALRDQGVLTESEFAAQKAKLLG